MFKFVRGKKKRVSAVAAKKNAENVGFFDGYDGNEIWGWAPPGDDKSPVPLALYINDTKICSFSANKFRDDLQKAGVSNGCVAFREKMPIREIFSRFGAGASLSVRDDRTGQELSYSPKTVRDCDLIWQVDEWTGSVLRGWIFDRNNPEVEILLQMFIDGQRVAAIPANQERPDLMDVTGENCRHGFHVPISPLSKGADFFRMKVEVTYDADYVICEEREIYAFEEQIKQLTHLQTYLREHRYGDGDRGKSFLVSSILPGLIDTCRERRDVPTASRRAVKISGRKSDIAVVIPVYRGVAETVSCLQSVLKSRNKRRFTVHVIADGCPEPEMLPAIQKLRKTHVFNLVQNDANLGFVATVNRGIALAEGRDVILLHSDTRVSDGWVDALAAEAASAEMIGTVTPISNNATVSSFPALCSDNELPDGWDVDRLAALCRTHVHPPVDIPAAHGFCMYIKRETLAEVGLFDEEQWGKGYGEDADFSLRASKLGWRHVITNKTFVAHLGEVSFAADAGKSQPGNFEKLNMLYPDYPAMIQRFIAADPMRGLRAELAIQLLRAEAAGATAGGDAQGKSMLFVSHTIGGGTDVAINSLATQLQREGQAVFLLTTEDNRIWRVQSLGSNVRAEFDIDSAYSALIRLLKALDIWSIQYHHVLQFGKTIWRLPADLKCEYDVTLHDYYSICPRADLVTRDDVYCGEPDARGCQECLNAIGVHAYSFLQMSDVGGDIDAWRTYFHEHLSHARKVFTPSEDTRDRILKYFPLNNIEARYHPESEVTLSLSIAPKSGGYPVNIGFLGAIGPNKGLNVIKGLAEEIAKTNTPARLTIIGYTSDDRYFDSYDFVEITGPYQAADLGKHMTDCHIDVVFLASICPETYGYTYSEAVRLGYPIVSYAVGALAERIGKSGWGMLVETDSTAADLLSQLIECATRETRETLTLGQEYAGALLSNYYGIQ